MAQDPGNRNFSVQLFALLVGLVLMGAKFLAWWLTNSNAILTDALESIINVVAAGFGLYSIIISAKPRDRNHPYGHGKIEFLSAGFEGALILLAGVAIWAKAGYNIVYPQDLHQLDIGLLLTALAGAINYGIGYYLQRKGQANNSIILLASGQHLKSDAYSSLGLVVGLGLVMATGISLLDNLVAILFGGIIFYTGLRLLRESIAGIMDEADYQLIKELVETLRHNRRNQWIDIHNFRVIKYGATLHVDCHMTVPWYLNTRESHGEVKELERLLRSHSTVPVEFFIHVDPCEPPENCRICQKENCPVRKAPGDTRVDWTLDNIMSNKKHQA